MHGDSQALVSVIVPIYNAEKYLDQCLDSITSQTHENLEVLCINDGSTDGSLAIIEAHAAADPRIRVIDKENGGYGQGCNRGIEAARGAWVSIVEPDDWIDPTMYEEMLAFADSFEETIDIVKTPWTDIHDWDDPEKQAPYPCLMKDRVKTSRHPFTLTEHPVLIELHPSIWSAIYRRDFLVEKGIRFIEYPGAGWADNPFLIETMVQAEAIVYLDKAFYNYRCDLPGSTLNHATDEAVARPFDRWLDMLAVLERLGVTDERIVMAHYLRGFNYTFGAIFDDGWDNPVVQAKTREVFSRMDPELVARIPNLAPHRKHFFYSVTGQPGHRYSRLPWARHLLREAGHTLATEGPVRVIRKVRRALVPEERSEA